MNIPKYNLVSTLQNLAEEYAKMDSAYDSARYCAKVESVGLIFSLNPEIVSANLDTIVTEDPKDHWGEILFKSLKEHQDELGIDFD